MPSQNKKLLDVFYQSIFKFIRLFLFLKQETTVCPLSIREEEEADAHLSRLGLRARLADDLWTFRVKGLGSRLQGLGFRVV